MPILSLTATGEGVSDGDGTMQVYCVQMQAIQQYSLELSACLPPPEEIALGKGLLESQVPIQVSAQVFTPVDSGYSTTVSELTPVSTATARVVTVGPSVNSPGASLPRGSTPLERFSAYELPKSSEPMIVLESEAAVTHQSPEVDVSESIDPLSSVTRYSQSPGASHAVRPVSPAQAPSFLKRQPQVESPPKVCEDGYVLVSAGSGGSTDLLENALVTEQPELGNVLADIGGLNSGSTTSHVGDNVVEKDEEVLAPSSSSKAPTTTQQQSEVVMMEAASVARVRGRMAMLIKFPVNVQLVLLTLYLCSVITSQGAWNPLVATAVSISPRNKVIYTRTEEVNAKCPALTPRESQPGDPESGESSLGLRRRLSIRYGDWEEAEPGSTSIIPFLQWNDSTLAAKTKLASFWVRDVGDKQGQVRQVQGTIQLIIIDGNRDLLPIPGQDGFGSFTMRRGVSVLSILVEGIYQQTVNDDVVCMLGCTFLPSPDSGVHFSNIQNAEGTKTLDRNCDIMVQLNYPVKDNLTSQVVHGTIQSLVSPGDHYRFSPISLSSRSVTNNQLYEVASRDFVSKACADISESDFVVSAYKASLEEFCVLRMRLSWLDIEPNWKCNSTIQNCRRIGPFSSYEEDTSFLTDYNTSNVRILVRLTAGSSPCYGAASDEIPVSLTLQLVPAHESEHVARRRSGLDGHTLVAEGYWSNRSNTLCMIACKVNNASSQTDDCNARVTLFIPSSLSISSRSLFKGKISSLLAQDHHDSFFPLSFHNNLVLKRSLPRNYSSGLFYNYSALDHARAILDRYEPENTRSLKTPWFKYPSLIGEEAGHYQSLGDDLAFYSGLQAGQGWIKWTEVQFDLVAMDKYLPFLWSNFVENLRDAQADEVIPVNDTIVTKTNPKWTHRRQEARKYMNCSGTLEFFGEADNYGRDDRFTIYTEGLYNPLDGKMYMVGCRSIKASWQQIEESAYDLVDGMDCEIEIVLQYPTTLSAWLLNPGVKVQVHSNRPSDDVFHFDDIDTETLPILYRGQREKVTSNKNIEGALSVLTLSMTLGCIISQLLYIESHKESIPYLSLTMLVAQALGFTIPLVTGAESLLARKFDYRQDRFFQGSKSVEIIVYVDKLLTLVALLLFLRLIEKVWRERSMRSDLGEAANVPKERNVLVICFIIHAVGFVSVMILHSQHSGAPGKDVTSVYGTANATQGMFISDTRRRLLWQVSKEYTGLVEDLFLLPQVIGFSLWDATGRPLRLSFYVGLTFLQIVPHVYDYLRPTSFDIYSSHIYANPSFDFYTDLGNILIPGLALFLAVLVYCQQRWKWFLRLPRRFLYQPLGTNSHETELVKANGRSHLPPIPEDDE